MRSGMWWLRQVGLALLACFFVFFGVQVLLAAYRLDDPLMFVMTFFASNFIILISAVMLIAFVFRMVSVSKAADEDED